MKTYHLSHTDLDGFASQVITKKVLKNEVTFFNSNYGKDIEKNLTEIFNLIDLSNEKAFILITDLNLTLEMASWLNKECENRAEKVTLQLLDHHNSNNSNTKVAKTYDWYYLDSSICGTKLCFNFYKKEIEKLSEDTQKNLSFLTECVNAYDLWKEMDELFNIGKILNYITFYTSYPFPKETKEEKAKFIIFSLYQASFFLRNGTSINKLEKKILPILKESFIMNSIPEELYLNEEITLEDKYHHYVYLKMKEMTFPVIKIGILNVKVFYGLDGGVFQNIGSIFNENKDSTYDACINVLKSGKLSLRSKGKENNVSEIARKYFSGNGHDNAAGGFLPTTKKEISRDEVYEILENLN